MKFARPTHRRPAESVIPMINVVFLLLIFFLMSARMTPPQPIDVTPPTANADTQAAAETVLFMAADGQLYFGDAIGDAAFDAFVQTLCVDQCRGTEIGTLRADKQTSGAAVANLMTRLGQAGLTQIELVTLP